MQQFHPPATALTPSPAGLGTRYFKFLQNADHYPVPTASTRHCVLRMVRGLFGAWIPRHFAAPLKHLASLGWSTEIADTDPVGTIADNADRLGKQIDRLCETGQRAVFLAHSKAGVELMLALSEQPARASAVAGLVGVQVPRAGAPFLEALFGEHSSIAGGRPSLGLRERVERGLLRVVGARSACSELDNATLRKLAATLESAGFTFPQLMVATSSRRLSHSLELRQSHLEFAFPGEPHDGVFRTQDQIWPGIPTLMLDGIDHSQPSVGGMGFAHDKFWAALLGLVLTMERP